MKVRCPSCGVVHHETTSKYRATKPAHGGMIRLIEPWASWGWGKFGARDGGEEIPWSEMECPTCAAPLAPDGKLSVIKPNGPHPDKRKRLTQDVIGLFPGNNAPTLQELKAKVQQTKTRRVQKRLANAR